MAKDLPVAWQVAQPEVMPAWFIVALLNAPVAKFEAEWQDSQDCVVGMWVLEGCFSAGAAMFVKLRPDPWHCAQLLVILT